MNREESRSRWTERRIRLVLIIGGIVVGLGIIEGVLRYLGWFSYVQYNLSPFGFHLAPDQNLSWAKPCLSITGLHTNNFGLRQRRDVRLRKDRFRIALLGDSFLEALQVGEQENIPALLGKLLGPRVEVINFGMSGYGTVQELAQYQMWVRRFHPDLCIVFFYMGNDVRNNHPGLERYPMKPYLVRTAGGWRLKYVSSGSIHRWHSWWAQLHRWLRRHLKIYDAFYRLVVQRVVIRWLGYVHTKKTPRTPRKGVKRLLGGHLEDLGAFFCPPPAKEWEEAWEITRQSLRLFREASARDASRCVLVLLPSVVQVAPDPPGLVQKILGRRLPPGFDPACPDRKLREYAGEMGIPVLLLLKPIRLIAASSPALSLLLLPL